MAHIAERKNSETAISITELLNQSVMIQQILSEICKHQRSLYWGSDQDIAAANTIYSWALDKGLITDKWIDERLRYSDTERYCSLLNEIFNDLPF